MTGILDISNGVMTIEKDDRLVFDTNYPLMNLIPEERIEIESFEIEFPSVWHGIIYSQTRVSNDPLPGDLYGCASFAGLVAQEWGPSASSPNTLSDQILGTVPAGTDYLDIMIRLNNTVVPAGWLDLPLFTNIPSNQWFKLEGGSCYVEGFNGFRRIFEIILDGTNVVLRRFQSVTSNGQVNRSYNFSATGTFTGFLAGTNAPTTGGTASYGNRIQVKGPSGGQNHRPPGAPISQDPCSTSQQNYRSVWTADIIITPGRISA